MRYQRITDPNKLCCEYRYHEQFYYALQILENEIESNTIQYRQNVITPRLDKTSGKHICRKCEKKLPKAYKVFCSNCGVRIRPDVISTDMKLYNTVNLADTIRKQQSELLGRNYVKDETDLWSC